MTSLICEAKIMNVVEYLPNRWSKSSGTIGTVHPPPPTSPPRSSLPLFTQGTGCWGTSAGELRRYQRQIYISGRQQRRRSPADMRRKRPGTRPPPSGWRMAACSYILWKQLLYNIDI